MIELSRNGAPVLYLEGAAGRAPGEVAELDRDEAKHVRALRLSAGEAVRVTDARGELRAAVLAGPAAVRLGERLEAPRRLPLELWAGIGSKQATLWLVEKAAEFGLQRLSPVEVRRSVSVADAGRSAAFWEKAGRRALAAVKQSGSAWAPEIADPATLAVALEGLDDSNPGPRVVLDVDAPPLATVLEAWPGHPTAVVLVGPEGGLAGEELDAARAAGFRPASLGPTVLRFETAAVAAMAIVAQLAMAALEPGPEGGPTT